MILDDKPDFLVPYLDPRWENTAARVHGLQSPITQHDTLAGFEEYRAVIRVLNRTQRSGKAQGDYQWLAVRIGAGALRKCEALLEALRAVPVPFGEATPIKGNYILDKTADPP